MADKQQESGFVKISRSILEWEWYGDVVTRCVFIHCILRANWKDTEWKGQRIKRGQFITSLASLSRETGFTVRQTRTALEHLKSTGELTSLSTSQYRIITVNNYDKFQQVTKQMTSDRQATDKADDKRPTTDKEYKKYKEKKEVYNTPIFSESVMPVVQYFFERYEQHTGEKHPPISQKKAYEIQTVLEEKSVDEDFVDEYFGDSKHKGLCGASDCSIYHFVSPKTLELCSDRLYGSGYCG